LTRMLKDLHMHIRTYVHEDVWVRLERTPTSKHNFCELEGAPTYALDARTHTNTNTHTHTLTHSSKHVRTSILTARDN